MFSWFKENIAVILVSLALLAVVVWIIVSMLQEKKERKILLWLQLCGLSYGGKLSREEMKKRRC